MYLFLGMLHISLRRWGGGKREREGEEMGEGRGEGGRRGEKGERGERGGERMSEGKQAIEAIRNVCTSSGKQPTRSRKGVRL